MARFAVDFVGGFGTDAASFSVSFGFMRASEAAALSSDIIGEVLLVPVVVAFFDAILVAAIATVAALPVAFRLPGLDFVFAFDGDFAGNGIFFPLRPGDLAVPTVAFDSVFGDALVGVLFADLVAPAR